MNGFFVAALAISVFSQICNAGYSSISLGPPMITRELGNHTVSVGQDFQFNCKVRANPLAYVAIKFSPVNNPRTVRFPRYGTAPTGGNTIVLLDLMNLDLRDEGRYTCFAENKYGTVQSHGWLKFIKECTCNMYGVAFPQKPCDDDGVCVCRENVGGEMCDKCQEGFFNFPFCFPCECNPWGTVGQSSSCDQNTGECNCLPDRSVFDTVKCDGCPPGEYYNVITDKCQPCRCFKEGSVTSDCDYITGECECKDKFIGPKCANCQDGFYSRANGCNPCDCVLENTFSADYKCDSVSGQCNCRNDIGYTDSRTCASCPENTYYDALIDECEDCGCDRLGSLRCTPAGECICKENFVGISCDQCEANHYGYNFGFCDPCGCNPYGTIGGVLMCDTSGNCPCLSGQNLQNWKQCDGCPDGQTISYQNPLECEDCNCHPRGSVDQNCDLYTSECECQPNVYGLLCDDCQPGYYGLSSYGECQPCNCDPYNSMSLECDADSGQCRCQSAIIFTDRRTCSGCPRGQYSKIPGTCEPCGCSPLGSISVQCDAVGQCACQSTVQGLKCDECKPKYYNFRAGGCDPCNCNKFGVEGDTPCDPITGQCNCKEGQNVISSRTCDGCPEGYYVNVDNPMECFSCNCNPRGAVDPNCDLYTGKCDCGPNVKGDKCDECEEGFYGLNLVGMGQCVPCECDPEGSDSYACNVYGQCQCKPGYGTINSMTCEGCPAGMYLLDGTCVPCGCDPRGAISNLCRADGSCFCASNVQYGKCDTCESWYYFGDPNIRGCIPCGCDGTGTIGGSGECDTNTGQCSCVEEASYYFIDPRICEPCSVYQYNFNNDCKDCDCHATGSSGLQCDFLTGQCPCVEGAYGMRCDSCAAGYYDLYQGCLPCNCDLRNTISGDRTCDIFGNCNCKPGLTFTDDIKCTTCMDGTFQNNGVCSPCDCHDGGAFDRSCDGVTGQCICLEGVTSRRCDQCEDETYGVNSYAGCKPCGCNVNGTVSRSRSCDQITGQCNCMDGRNRYEARTCDGCINNFFTNEYVDPVTKQCTSCDCLDVGSTQFNCTVYEGICDCNPGIIGDKCDIIPESRGDAVLRREQAVLTCNLPKGSAEKTVWMGEGCESDTCGDTVLEATQFMSLTFQAMEDKSFICRFIFEDGVVIDKTATVDVVTFDLGSVTVQKGTEVTLTANVGELIDSPIKGITWKKGSISCKMEGCNIEGHDVVDTITTVDKQYSLTSKISLGAVQKTVRYQAVFKYRQTTFRAYSVVTVYECNCNPIGSTGVTCDSVTLQCVCKNRYTGKKCDECQDEYYNPASGCLACDCDPDMAAHNVCDKASGQCECPLDVGFIDTRRCEMCPAGKYLLGGACVPCACVQENTMSNTAMCDYSGQCPCDGMYPYVATRTCKRCTPGSVLEDGACVDCRCFPLGSNSAVCDEYSGACDCKQSYIGDKCDTCLEEFYDPSGDCIPCNCDPDNSLNNACDGVTGQCLCLEDEGPFVDPVRCGACADYTILVDGACERCEAGTFVQDNVCTFCDPGSYFKQGACVDCTCSPIGSLDNICNKVGGECDCKDRFESAWCEECVAGYYSHADGCLDCGCVPENSISSTCNKQTGQCQCDPSRVPFVDTRVCETCPDNHIVVDSTCEVCPEGTYVKDNTCTYCRDGLYLGDDGLCVDCGCVPVGSEDSVCNRITGICTCLIGFEGDKCGDCQAGYYPLGGACAECGCNVEHTVDGDYVCEDDGQCPCTGDRPYIQSRTCDPCPDGLVIVDGYCKKCEEGTYIVNYECVACLCSEEGTDVCNPFTGECTCKPTFTGALCDECKDGFYTDSCTPCFCAPNSLSRVCDKTSGACSCAPHFTGRTCNECEDGYYGGSCSECECIPAYSSSDVCDKATGQCDCTDGLYYKDTRACETCPDHHKVQNSRCVQCDSGTELINNVCVACAEGHFQSFGKCRPCFCSALGMATCNRVTGECTCTSRYTGDTCDTCVAGRYAPENGCVACGCDPDNSADDNCDVASGQCSCVDYLFLFDSRTCELCPANHILKRDGTCQVCDHGYYKENNICRTCDDRYYLRFGECTECRCNPAGYLSEVCDPITGVCECKHTHQGEKCQNCQVGYYPVDPDASLVQCTECGCVLENTIGGSVDKPGMKECGWKGQCFCKDGLSFVNPRTCETCPTGQVPRSGVCRTCDLGTYYKDMACTDCICNPVGSVDNGCDAFTGVCTCVKGYQGDTCSECADGYYSAGGVCKACGCDGTGSQHGVCDKETGQCVCNTLDVYDTQRTCFNCAPGTFLFSGECTDCNCYTTGSSASTCDRAGICTCLNNVEGDKCERCAKNHYGLNSESGCIPCGCNPYGTQLKDLSCDATTGQCNCRNEQTRYEPRTCDGCGENKYLGGENRTCTDCLCNPEGSLNYQCDLYSGKCACNKEIVGDKCDTRGCVWRVWVVGKCSVTCGGGGIRTKTRTQEPSKGGDFTTISKYAECNEVQTKQGSCPPQRPCPN